MIERCSHASLNRDLIQSIDWVVAICENLRENMLLLLLLVNFDNRKLDFFDLVAVSVGTLPNLHLTHASLVPRFGNMRLLLKLLLGLLSVLTRGMISRLPISRVQRHHPF